MQDIAHLIGQERGADVVDQFYERVRQHPTLQVPFALVEDWPEHKAILTHFWWNTLGGERYMDYRYAVASKHMAAGFTPELLADWLTLFKQTLSDVLPPELAEPWLERARLIGQSLTMMHEFQMAKPKTL